MVVAMAAAMVAGTRAAALAASALLLLAALALARPARSRPALQEHVVDLLAMALVLGAGVMGATGAGHGHGGGSGAPMVAAVVAGWALIRLAMWRHGRSRLTAAQNWLGAGITAAGLALMTVM
jgi:hypothetical protein